MSGGDFGIFLTRPISITLLVLAALIVAVSTLRLAALKTIRSAETSS
jgi:TctA family transporter